MPKVAKHCISCIAHQVVCFNEDEHEACEQHTLDPYYDASKGL